VGEDKLCLQKKTKKKRPSKLSRRKIRVSVLPKSILALNLEVQSNIFYNFKYFHAWQIKGLANS